MPRLCVHLGVHLFVHLLFARDKPRRLQGGTLSHEFGHIFDSHGYQFIRSDDGKNTTMQAVEVQVRIPNSYAEFQKLMNDNRCFLEDMIETCCIEEGEHRICSDPFGNQVGQQMHIRNYLPSCRHPFPQFLQLEDSADLIAVTLAFDAYSKFAMEGDVDRSIERSGGRLSRRAAERTLTQKFFYTMNAVWCPHQWRREEHGFHVLGSVSHSPWKCRTNTVSGRFVKLHFTRAVFLQLMRQHTAFARAFDCDARTDHMARPAMERCNAWN